MFRIGSATRRRLHFALRTSYSLALCGAGMHAWRWSGSTSYISLAIVVLMSSMYLGQWQISAWKVLYSSFFGTSLGVIGRTLWATRVLYALFFFAAILLINKCSFWDQFSKIFCGLCFVISVFTATSTASGGAVFLSTMLMINMPSLIVGASLLVPPALAADSCARKVRAASQKLGDALVMYCYAFCDPDVSDMYLFEAEAATQAASQALLIAASLREAVECEAFLFTSLATMSPMLLEFVDTAKGMIDEFENMRGAHSRIIRNTTHKKFVSLLGPVLKDATSSALVMINCATKVIVSYTDNLWYKRFLGVRYWASLLYRCLRACRCSCGGGIQNGSDDIILGESLPSQRAIGLEGYIRIAENSSNYMSSLFSMSEHRAELHSEGPPADVEAPAEDRYMAMAVAAEEYETRSGNYRHSLLDKMHQERFRLASHRALILLNQTKARERFLFFTENAEGQAPPPNPSGAMNTDPDHPYEPVDGLTSDQFVGLLLQEHLALGIRNIAPRGTFLLRVLFLLDILLKLESGLANVAASDYAWSWSSLSLYVFSGASSIRQFVESTVMDALSIFQHIWIFYLSHLFLPQTVSVEEAVPPFYKYFITLVSAYLQPFKIALAGTICGLLVMVPSWRESNPYGAWAATVVMIVRQDNSSSSFIRGYQRMEGTVIGAVFSFGMIKLLSGTRNNETLYDLTLFLCLTFWVGVCAYFREVENHGYSATVSAITPVILIFANPNESDLENVAWSRVAMTFFGVIVYLIVDNSIFPTRSDSQIRLGTADIVKDIRSSVNKCKSALEILLSVTSISVVSPQDKDASTGVAEQEPQTARLRRDRSVSSGTDDSTFNRSIVLSAEHQGSVSEQEVDGAEPAATLSLRIYEKCRHIIRDEVYILVHSLKNKLEIRSGLLKLAANEPKLWHKAYPQMVFEKLHVDSIRTARSLSAVSTAILYLCDTLAAMPTTGGEEGERGFASENLQLLDSMSRLLLIVSDSADVALNKVVLNISRIQEGHNLRSCESDVSSMVLLSHNCDVLIDKMNEKFRVYYYQQLDGNPCRREDDTSLGDSIRIYVGTTRGGRDRTHSIASERTTRKVNSTKRLIMAKEGHYSDFIVSWQAIVDSMYELNKNLASLGLSLHNLLAVETATAATL